MNDKEYEELLERVNEEYDEILNQKDNLTSKSQIENWAYEVTYKKDFLEMIIEKKNLSETTFDVLKETKYPLSDMYDEWMSKDDDFLEQKREMMDDTYYYIAQEIKQRKMGDLLNSKIFTKAQKEQIERGFNNGLTVEQVEVYANPKFDDKQMEQLRIIQECDFSKEQVDFIANPKFDSNTMLQIRVWFEYGKSIEEVKEKYNIKEEKKTTSLADKFESKKSKEPVSFGKEEKNKPIMKM